MVGQVVATNISKLNLPWMPMKSMTLPFCGLKKKNPQKVTVNTWKLLELSEFK